MQRSDILVDAAALKEILSERPVTVLDCRFDLGDPEAGIQAFRDGHIPGAGFADLERDLSGPVTPGSGRHPLPSGAQAVDAFRRLGVRQGVETVVYDAVNSALAARAWWMLRWLGHGHVRILDGGYQTWLQRDYPVEKGAARLEAGDFAGDPDDGRVVEVDELLSTDIKSAWLCDARDEDRFNGRREPIDKVAGHIPGARNTPFLEALDAEGRFLPTEQLKETWVEHLGGELNRNWIAMCGSGVTACHLAVAALLAGAAEPRIYAGSWSEWINDASRPISS